MAKKVYEETHIANIAETIRSYARTTSTYKTSEMPNGVAEVYGMGYNDGVDTGFLDGQERGQEEGKAQAYQEIEHLNAELEQTLYGTDTGGKSYYDEFWDNFQAYGKRENYQQAFSRGNFNNKTFYPKYDIAPIGSCEYMFYSAGGFGSVIIEDEPWSLKRRLNECGVVLDTSMCTSLNSAFAYTWFSEIPTIDLTGLTREATQLFYSCWNRLVTIEKLIVNETIMFANCFVNDSALTNLTIEGTIGQNGFNVQWSPLTHDSLMSIINSLKDYSDDTSGTEWKVIIGSENYAKLTTDEILIAEQKGWSID